MKIKFPKVIAFPRNINIQELEWDMSTTIKSIKHMRKGIASRQSPLANCIHYKNHNVVSNKIDNLFYRLPVYNPSPNLCPVRFYSQQTFKPGMNGRNWITIALCGTIAAGGAVAVYKVLSAPHQEIPEMNKKNEQTKAPTKFPVNSELIPDEIPYLIIGGGTAGFSAFRSIKSNDPTAKVLVVTNEPYYPYMRPPLSKELIYGEFGHEPDDIFHFNQWDGKKRSVYFEPVEFYTSLEELNSTETGGISVIRGWTVTKLDHDKKMAFLEDGKAIKYNKCLIATGSKPKQLAIPSSNKFSCPEVSEKISYYASLDDFIKLQENIKEGIKSVIIIGNSFGGSELACSLARKGLLVTQLYKEKNNLEEILPEYLSETLTMRVEKLGVNLINNANIEQVELIDDKVKVTTEDGRNVTADYAIIAVGAVPNTDLAEESALETDKLLGGYVVNSEFEIRKDLYAAGDCASFYDPNYGRRRIDHHDHAIVSGRLAGENMTGEGKSFAHQSMFWCDLMPYLGLEAIGLVDSSLPTIGVYLNETEEESEQPSTDQQNFKSPVDFKKGVVFYLRNEKIVGILFWNVFNRVYLARRALKGNFSSSDAFELAKHFKIAGITVSKANE